MQIKESFGRGVLVILYIEERKQSKALKRAA
jgi:hypothetical protein